MSQLLFHFAGIAAFGEYRENRSSHLNRCTRGRNVCQSRPRCFQRSRQRKISQSLRNEKTLAGEQNRFATRRSALRGDGMWVSCRGTACCNVFSDRTDSAEPLDDFDRGRIARINFDRPYAFASEYKIDAEQADELEIYGQDVTEFHKRIPHEIRHRPWADGTGILKAMRAEPGLADKVSSNA